jgi:integrase
VIHVRAQLSRAHRHQPARRVPPKTPPAIRDIPLVPQLAAMLRAHQCDSPLAAGNDRVFATSRGTPLGHRNAERRALARAARGAGLEDGAWPRLRFHDLRKVRKPKAADSGSSRSTLRLEPLFLDYLQVRAHDQKEKNS